MPLTEIERISAILRMIHGKTVNEHNAFAEFHTYSGFISFTDVIDNELNRVFRSEICADKKTHEKWFSINAENDFTKLAEFCVENLHSLCGNKSGYPLQVNFFMPAGEVPRWDDLPEQEQVLYCGFKWRFHTSIAQFHKLMAIGSATLSETENEMLLDTISKMENSLEEFPAWLKKLTGHRLSHATDNQTELRESLIMLRQNFVPSSVN
jgi:hypothetical protein